MFNCVWLQNTIQTTPDHILWAFHTISIQKELITRAEYSITFLDNYCALFISTIIFVHYNFIFRFLSICWLYGYIFLNYILLNSFFLLYLYILFFDWFFLTCFGFYRYNLCNIDLFLSLLNRFNCNKLWLHLFRNLWFFD